MSPDKYTLLLSIHYCNKYVEIFSVKLNFLDLLFILIVYFYFYVKMSDCTRFQMAFGSHIEVLQ